MLGFLNKHRQGLLKTAGVAGGVYLASKYAVERLEDVREKVVKERMARDTLKRRFDQNMDDISYTVMALIPTLADQILAEMDLEGLTSELQAKARARAASPSTSVASGSVDVVSVQAGEESQEGQDARSDAMSAVSSEDAERLGESSTSWALPSQAPTSEPDAEEFHSLSDSVTTSSSAMSFPTPLSDVGLDMTASEVTRTKAELWQEIKILSFTRTLTVLYSTTLLALFTSVQLSLLARDKYVSSVQSQERDERMRERVQAQMTPSALLFGSLFGVDMDPWDFDLEDGDELSEELETKYLTLSWWILHVGWKDLGERVRRGVEEVFDGVSLKTKLGVVDLHRLASDVRRRVEHEITFEGNEKRTTFVSSLLPPTPEMLQHVLVSGGIPASTTPDPEFNALLFETRRILSGPDFARVLEVALDKATEVLFQGLERNVFLEGGEMGEEVRIRLAGLLPGLSRWSALALTGMPNELIDGVLGVREANALCAIVFSSYEERFQ